MRTPRRVSPSAEREAGLFAFMHEQESCEQPKEQSGGSWCGGLCGGGGLVAMFASDLAAFDLAPTAFAVPGAQLPRRRPSVAAAAALTAGPVLSGLQYTLQGGPRGGLAPRQRAELASQADCGAAAELRGEGPVPGAAGSSASSRDAVKSSAGSSSGRGTHTFATDMAGGLHCFSDRHVVFPLAQATAVLAVLPWLLNAEGFNAIVSHDGR